MKKKKLARIIGNIALIGAVATAATAAYTAYSRYKKINKELDTEEYEDDATAAFNNIDFEEPENDSNSSTPRNVSPNPMVGRQFIDALVPLAVIAYRFVSATGDKLFTVKKVESLLQIMRGSVEVGLVLEATTTPVSKFVTDQTEPGL